MKNRTVLSQLKALAPANLSFQMASIRQKEVRANSCSRSNHFLASTTLIIVGVVIIDQAMTSARSRRSKALVAMGSKIVKARTLHPLLSHNNMLTRPVIMVNQPIHNHTSHKASVKTPINSVETSWQQYRNSSSSQLHKWQGAYQTTQLWIQWWTICYNICRRPTKISKNL